MKHSDNPRPKLYLLDGHALCYRAFYAVQGLTNSKGVPTNAVLGFLNTLRKILREHKPGYAAVCFDSRAKTHRQEKFADYKIHRKPMPDELIPQIDLIKRAVDAFRIPALAEDGYEADDLIAAMAKRFAPQADIVIVTDDKDIFQIIDKRITIYSPRKDALFGVEDVKDIWDVGPEYIADMLGLAGDDSDNIPGVDGIGKVTAAKLINEYGHLENIYKNIDAMKPSKIKENLIRDKDQAFLSRDLAVLDDDAPVNVSFDQLKNQGPDKRKLYELLQELEFKAFLKDYAPDEESSLVQADVSAAVNADICKDLGELVKGAKASKCLAWVLDSTESSDMFSSLWASCGDGRVWQVPQADIASLKSVLEDAAVAKIVYDLKASLRFLDDRSVTPAGEIFDVMLAAYALGETSATLAYNDIFWKYLHQTPPAVQGHAVVHLKNLKSVLEKELKDKNLEKLLYEIEQPLSYVLFGMERQGVAIDWALLKELSGECGGKMALIEKDLHESAGGPFNLNSPKQLAVILFEKLKLPATKKTKTGYSTDEEVLSQLASEHPLPGMILEYRQYAKLKSTYIDALPELADSKTGRIHTEFLQIGAETGRLSSRHPNLQNIPIRTELGRKIRKAFIPSEKGWRIVSADYSQVELRILAHLSGDKNLSKAFLQGQDVHAYTAAQIFDIKESEVDYHMRDTAKRVNFGIIYGMSAFGLSKDLNISPMQAKTFIEKYFNRYPDVKKFMDQCIKGCEEKGFVSTMFNRRRYLPDINNKNGAIRQFAQRQAINTPVQGSAADLIKLSMIRVHEALQKKKLKTRMLITVHDELVFESPDNEIESIVAVAREHMEHSIKLDVPITVHVKAGKNWLEMDSV